jgi:hypothetical protein
VSKNSKSLGSTVPPDSESTLRGGIEDRPITPRQFALEMIQAAQGDPGTENKCMLFHLMPDDRELRFLRCRSEARVMVMELRLREDRAQQVPNADTLEILRNIKTEIVAGMVLFPKSPEEHAHNNACDRASHIINNYAQGFGLFQMTRDMKRGKGL